MEENAVKQCPLNHTECIKERCRFWLEFVQWQQSPIAGMKKSSDTYECALVIGLVLLGKIASSTLVLPPLPIRPNVMKGG